MPVQPMLLHRMALVSFRLFCKNLGNLQEFFGQMVYRPPWPEIARTPMKLRHGERRLMQMVEQNGGKFRRLEIIKKTLLLVGIKNFLVGMKNFFTGKRYCLMCRFG